MSDDIVVNMNFNLGKDQTVTDIIDRLLPFIHDEMRMPAGMIKDVIEEIERLRAEVARLNTFLHPIGVVINQVVRGD